MCILNSFITGAQTAIWLHILKNYISKVIYHSLKSYTSFERTYNKLSKKNILLSDTEKNYEIHFLIIYAKIHKMWFCKNNTWIELKV